MTAIRIVCAPDAGPTAKKLERLLSAELYDVRLTQGSLQSEDDLPAARKAQEIVLLIWSPNAHMARFPRDWRAAIPPSRLVEIARTPGRLREKDGAHPIDFVSWRGERGGRAWGALKERLRQVANQWEPPKPPPYRQMAAAGVATACAVTGAFMFAAPGQTAHQQSAQSYDEFALVEVGAAFAGGGMGGATRLLEPPSADELERPLPMPARLRASATHVLARYEAAPFEVVEARLPPPSFFERLMALNPLLRDNDE